MGSFDALTFASEETYTRERALQKRVSLSVLEKVICKEFGLTSEEFLSTTLKRRITHPRQIYMYLAVKDAHCSLSRTARHLKKKDGETVRHGVHKVANLLEAGDSQLLDTITRIRAQYP